ncbi:MAG: hypothetical protein IPL86_19150 [Flavobacteriales bacterium]|nr:hypothetical protein [Flavobacteriales bacterium]
MALAHITIDINDDIKNMILQLWSTRKLQLPGITLELSGKKTVITLDAQRLTIEPPASVSGELLKLPLIGPVRAGTTVSALSCDVSAGTITVELNHCPIGVNIT